MTGFLPMIRLPGESVHTGYDNYTMDVLASFSGYTEEVIHRLLLGDKWETT
ncbi:MAG: hypothetical protein IJT77_07195 [Clostridia bacterium]|nr:hypothetical protein [Clostridia bacterium]